MIIAGWCGSNKPKARYRMELLKRMVAPLTRLGATLDTHVDAEVRQALEPLRGFAEALRLHPDFAEAEVQTAMSYMRENRPADAVPHAGRALGIRPAMPDALYVLGSALDTLGRTAEAKEQYEAAIAARPDYAEAHQNLGDLLVAGGRTAEAIPHFEAALRANPDFAEARHSLEAARRAVR